MENYEVLSIAGEGSYGIVMKCKHKNSKKLVAIKKLIDIENDNYIRKMAFREIRILKKLQHANLVKLLDVFKKKKRFYLVFEYLDRTVLDDLEDNPNGLGEQRTKEYMYQLVCAIEYCHSKSVIHRDIKPENLLVSKTGILKLCDFGFARVVTNSNGSCTEYIATRWYRAPELLVRDRKYGKPVDIWAIGCVFVELFTGEPIFPGDSDVDQLYRIIKCFGKLCHRHQLLLNYVNKSQELNEINEGLEMNSMNNIHALHSMFPSWSTYTLNIVASCLNLDPNKRLTATQLLNHEYFEENHFKETFHSSVHTKIKQLSKSPLIPISQPSRTESHSNFSTPRTLYAIKTPPSSPMNSFIKIPSGYCRSPESSCDTYSNHHHKIMENNSTNNELIVPIKFEHLIRHHQNTPTDSPISLVNSGWYPATDLKFRSLNDYKNVCKSRKENTKLFPNPEVVQAKRDDINVQKMKINHLSSHEVNLPLLNSAKFVIQQEYMRR